MMKAKKGVFKRNDGQCVCFVDECASLSLNGKTYYVMAVKNGGCELLVNTSKCDPRKIYRDI